VTFAEWEQGVPQSFRDDPLWTVTAYRMALFLADLAWNDATKLMRDQRTRDLSSQMCRAVGSISANVSEGYSRFGKKDRARFYAYALGSARESRGWYYKGRHVLGEDVFEHRMELLTQIIRLLMRMVPSERSQA
jgi:four helix bundle protein